MTHWVILPVLLPLIGGLLQLVVRNFGLPVQRSIGLVFTGGLMVMGIKILMLSQASETLVYHLGDWPAPFGIVLVLDRLAAMMVLLTSVLALAALGYANLMKVDEKGWHFHVLFQLQLFGLNGAFLTGDVFNLFVFFEVMLLASYGLLLHGSGAARTRAGLHYVVINLIGSTVFLFAVGALYGAVGTLNIADMALKVAAAPAERSGLIAAAGLLLLVVFALKAAMFPLYLWLPQAYANTSAPVAAFFAIMTKVGVYAIIRVHGTVFGEQAGELAWLHLPWVLGGGLVTLVLSALGIMAARGLREQVAYLVLASVATLLVAVGLNGKDALAAGLYYLLHSTLLAGAFFLLADLIRRNRGAASDRFDTVAQMQGGRWLGIGFFFAAVALAGLPPMSGFIGKIMILDAALEHPWRWQVLTSTLAASLLIMLALVRSGSFLFFRPQEMARDENAQLGEPPNRLALVIIGGMLLMAPLLVLFAGGIMDFTIKTSTQLQQVPKYIEAVLEKPLTGSER
ncbi:MAG: monovalent cation/H+ antiporter subunit D [Verrucomicrobiae bacterium]|nr:monovalent cation/H+ antiporter subunit D [Verrucomicrobiae bacterium]